MSISKFVGRCTILSLIVYLFVKGALVLRPRETTAALSALLATLVHACCGADANTPPEVWPSAQTAADCAVIVVGARGCFRSAKGPS